VNILRLAVSMMVGTLLPGITGVAVASAASSCADVGGNIQSGNVCHAQTVTPAYMIDLRFGTDYPDDPAVSAYLIGERDHLIGLAQAPGAQYLPYSMNVMWENQSSGQPQRTTLGPHTNATPTDPPHGTYSLLLKVIIDNANGQVGQQFKAFNFDFDQNRPVTLENLFSPDVNPMDAIYPVIAADLKRQYTIRGLDAPSVRPPAEVFRNFVITDDALTFYFDAGKIMPFFIGGVTSTIPRAKLPPLAL
jgi:Protein of unknown function (DUF3298)